MYPSGKPWLTQDSLKNFKHNQYLCYEVYISIFKQSKQTQVKQANTPRHTPFLISLFTSQEFGKFRTFSCYFYPITWSELWNSLPEDGVGAKKEMQTGISVD